MFNFLRKKTEPKPENRNYTAQIITNMVTDAEAGTIAGGRHLAAAEIAAGLYARAFNSSKIISVPQTDRLKWMTPELLGYIARQLIKCGEAVVHFDIVNMNGTAEIVFQIATTWNIHGNEQHDAFYYDLTLTRPSGHDRLVTTGDSVLHFKYACDSRQPWRGISPLTGATQSVLLLSQLERNLAKETATPSAYVVPVPTDGGDDSDDDNLRQLKNGIANNSLSLVETTAGAWGMDSKVAAPSKDWEQKRVGANPPSELVELREQVGNDILAACGVPSGLAYPKTTGTARRECWREFLHGSVQPVAALLADEIQTKLEIEKVEFNFDALFASDVSGRARAFNSFVSGGMDIERAAKLSGVLITDDDME